MRPRRGMSHGQTAEKMSIRTIFRHSDEDLDNLSPKTINNRTKHNIMDNMRHMIGRNLLLSLYVVPDTNNTIKTTHLL